MKRADLEALRESAMRRFEATGWALPPHPKWDITDFGLGDWRRHGLVLVNLAEEPEYCEKLMYARRDMTTPMHCHRIKKEDIICRSGDLAVRIGGGPAETVMVKVNGISVTVHSGVQLTLQAGERVTLLPGVLHEFWPLSEECVIGEVSTANDDETDNFFTDPNVGRFPVIED